ncbi:unnamed protein product [Effrenium voratum]|nr:unnamed protein product [Effrenium voratum]
MRRKSLADQDWWRWHTATSRAIRLRGVAGAGRQHGPAIRGLRRALAGAGAPSAAGGGLRLGLPAPRQRGAGAAAPAVPGALVLPLALAFSLGEFNGARDRSGAGGGLRGRRCHGALPLASLVSSLGAGDAAALGAWPSRSVSRKMHCHTRGEDDDGWDLVDLPVQILSEPPRGLLAACAAPFSGMRKFSDALRQWLEYHFQLGLEHFFLYDYDGSLASSVESSRVSYFPFFAQHFGEKLHIVANAEGQDEYGSLRFFRDLLESLWPTPTAFSKAVEGTTS